MKAWQIFVVGVAVLVAVLLLPSYEAILAGLAAIALVTVVVGGFLLRPRKEIFYLRTTLVIKQPRQSDRCNRFDGLPARAAPEAVESFAELWLGEFA